MLKAQQRNTTWFKIQAVHQIKGDLTRSLGKIRERNWGKWMQYRIEKGVESENRPII